MRARSPQSAVAVVAALHLALLPAVATASGVAPAAATAVQREQAQQKFVRGKELFGQKKYSEALAEFRGSLDIVASPNARLYVARCLRETGKLVEAYVEFGRTEVEAKELAPQDPRYLKTGESAAAERKELEPKLGFVIIHVQNAADDTKLVIAGEELRRAGWNEPAPVLPGTTEISVETPGRAPVKQTVTLKAGEKTELTIDAGAAPEGKSDKPPPSVDTPPPSAPASSGSDLRPWAFVAGGIGAAGLITFGVFGAMATSRYNTLKNDCRGPCPESRRSDVEGGKTQQTIANIGLVVGVIGVAAGVTLFVLGSGKKEAPASASAQVVVGPSYVGLQGAF